ncbi:sugar phosphate isomerase/epimerase [Brenneria populi subsp. brevivirga]|uniref:sugar phosphate isomerase/epimerase family protein n=1 Tax=Brenneria populi TaxID=1505588 RepID=UPI002E1868BC|nr:sugar phosphate isomerase/epimerase [Brenneria populi subsp. brevivirga]
MLKKSYLYGGLLLLSSFAVSAPQAAAPVSDKGIALQMYTLRNVGDADAQFKMAHDAGFKHVELVGDHGLSAERMNVLLKENDLQPISAHVQLAALEQRYAETVAFNKAIGNRVIIVPWVDAEERPDSAQGWKNFALRLNDLGEKLRKDHMLLGYHNHNFEMKKYDGKTALEIIFDHASPENLLMEMDAAWVSRGGQDPALLLKKYPGRVYAIHAKDNSAIGVRDNEMNFAPLGEGLLDWKSILPAAKSSGVKWFIVEHDAPQDPWGVITTSYRNLSKALADAGK